MRRSRFSRSRGPREQHRAARARVDERLAGPRDAGTHGAGGVRRAAQRGDGTFVQREELVSRERLTGQAAAAAKLSRAAASRTVKAWRSKVRRR
jgi:hypothetical protein